MKKKGFTLAEVLITLGIIGVVAAVTMPTLMADTKYKQVGVKLAKFHTNLENAARAYAAEHESIESADDFKSFINQYYVFKDIYSTDDKGNTTAGGSSLAATTETTLVGSKSDFTKNYAILKDDTKIAFGTGSESDIDTTKYPENKYGVASYRVYFNPNVQGLSSNSQSIYSFIVTTNGHVMPSKLDTCTETLFTNNWIVKKEYYSEKASTIKQGGKDVDVPGACYKG